jgi:RNA-directed DNA polymerase
VSLERARHQKPDEEPGLAQDGRGEAPNGLGSGEARTAANGDERSGTDALMEEVVGRQNVLAALERVRRNKGSPGIDGMTVDELRNHLVGSGHEIRARLLDGTYEPQPVRKVEIPKAGGEVRTLGIPTVLDRFVQQCILQVLQKRFDATFSESSHGFRPRRGAHGAVRAAQRYVQGRRTWVVDVDLEKFFDRVNHDVLMGRLAKRIADKRMLAIIRRFLSAGMMAEGVVIEREEGTPQGGPLSPLLANVLLDEVDKELEKRGHRFARYADDLNVYVSSERAGRDVMELLRRLFAGLRLKVNETKSAVAPCWTRKFLGFTLGRGSSAPIQIASKSLEKMKERVRDATSRNSGRSVDLVVQDLATYLRGWKNYFRIACTVRLFRQLDEWLRRRLRALMLSRWKNGWRTFAELRRYGASLRSAGRVARGTRRYWNTSRGAIDQTLDVAFFDGLGLPRLSQTSTL